MELIDSHCHLQFSDLSENIGQVLSDAKAAGVGRIICVGTNLDDSQIAIDLAAAHDNVWASVGVHPHDAQDFLKNPDSAKILNKLSKLPRVVAVGEIGLDYYHQNSPRPDQHKSLRQQIEIGAASGLPLIFHVREAWDDFWPMFDDYKIKNGVIHSFSADEHQLDNALSRGLYIGLNGIMTFTKDKSQLSAARKAPLDRVLLETDAPFLTPAPYRGQPCQPKHARVTAEFLAKLRGESLQDLAAASTANSTRLFNLPGPKIEHMSEFCTSSDNLSGSGGTG